MLGRLCAGLLVIGLVAGCGSSDTNPAGSGGAAGAAGSGGAAGSAGSAGGAGAAGTGGTAPTIPFACPGGTIAPGSNTLSVDGAQRTFFADFPSDTSKPIAVVFSWHGYGDTAANFRNLGLGPDADPSFPFVVITPEDTNLFPPAGLDWAIFQGADGDKNADADLFEGVLGCLNEQYSIDASRLYSVGFSAGAIMTNLLHSRYPKLLAATLAYSGAWFDDSAEAQKVNTLGLSVSFSWNPLLPADGGAVLITHGGASDQFGIGGNTVIDFEQEAALAVPYLTAGGRTVVECAHTSGHTPDPEVTAAVVRKFLSAHQLGHPSPLTSGTFAGYPSGCSLHTP